MVVVLAVTFRQATVLVLVALKMSIMLAFAMSAVRLGQRRQSAAPKHLEARIIWKVVPSLNQRRSQSDHRVVRSAGLRLLAPQRRHYRHQPPQMSSGVVLLVPLTTIRNQHVVPCALHQGLVPLWLATPVITLANLPAVEKVMLPQTEVNCPAAIPDMSGQQR